MGRIYRHVIASGGGHGAVGSVRNLTGICRIRANTRTGIGGGSGSPFA